MNIPNSLTLARIFFVPLLVAVLVQERMVLHFNGAVLNNDVIALIIFWVAAATDLAKAGLSVGQSTSSADMRTTLTWTVFPLAGLEFPEFGEAIEEGKREASCSIPS